MKEIPGSAERKEEATPARAEENKHEKAMPVMAPPFFLFAWLLASRGAW